MKGCRCNFEGESDQGHGKAGEQQRRRRLRVQLVRNGRKTGATRHSVNKAQSKKRKSTGGTAKEKIFQPSFGRSDVAFVERGHQIKRQPGKFEPNENHE